MPLITEARNATLEDMVNILQNQRARRLDLVVPASQVQVQDGLLELNGADPIEKYEDLGDGSKVLIEQYDPNGLYRPTGIFDEHIATRFDIPLRYVRRLRKERVDLYDANVNGWVKGGKLRLGHPTPEEIKDLMTDEALRAWAEGAEAPEGWFYDADGMQWMKVIRQATPADKRKFFLRLFRGEEGEEGVARALMSNRFAPFDNLDGLTALLTGLKEAGIDQEGVKFDHLDLTERGMHVRVSVPEIQALAPNLAQGYRNPFGNGGPERARAAVRDRDIDQWRQIAAEEGMGYTEAEGGEPVVFAGLGFSNSENGNGGWSLWPEVIVKVCKNGLQMNAFAVTRRHVGASLEEGVQWSHETHKTNLDLVVSQTKDLVSQFLSADYLQERVNEIEAKAGAEVGFDTKSSEKIEAIGKKVGFSDEHVEGILNFYLRGGQPTAGGVANAITAYSQTVRNPDVAHELDAKAMDAMVLAAR